METKLLSIKDAAKYFGVPVNKLYRLVNDRECPFIELETLSGNKSIKINTRTFADWLDEKAKKQEII